MKIINILEEAVCIWTARVIIMFEIGRFEGRRAVYTKTQALYSIKSVNEVVQHDKGYQLLVLGYQPLNMSWRKIINILVEAVCIWTARVIIMFEIYLILLILIIL